MRVFAFSALATVMLATLTQASVVTTVGAVQAVQKSAYGTPPDAAKAQKHDGDGVAYQELLETLQQSGLLVRFSDGSKLTVGASSRVLVDDFVYDPQDPQSKALISLPAGALRYVTGTMPKGHTTIDTPTATMVLRGTNVTVGVGPNGTHLDVHEGLVSVHDKITGQDTTVDAGSSVEIGDNGIETSSQQSTGDPVVDDGIASAGGSDTSEPRRGEPSQHERPSNNGGSRNPNGGGSPG